MSVSFFARKGNQLLNKDNDINLSNRNAMIVLQTLSFRPDEYCGGVKNDELENFILRCDLALQLIKAEPSLDPGMPTTTYSEPGKMTMIDFGLPAGYLQERITQLRDLACFAYKHGAELSWG